LNNTSSGTNPGYIQILYFCPQCGDLSTPAYYEPFAGAFQDVAPAGIISSLEDGNLSNSSVAPSSLDRFNAQRFKVLAGNFRNKGYSSIASIHSDLANYALDATVTASSSSESASFGLVYTHDSVEQASAAPYGWITPYTDTDHTEWIQFHFPWVRNVASVKLFPGGCTWAGWARSLSIQTWTGVSWVTLATAGPAYPGCGSGVTISFPPTMTSDIRINVTSERPGIGPHGSSRYFVSLGEVEIQPPQ